MKPIDSELIVKDLSYFYGNNTKKTQALKDINLTFQQGKITTVIGPSGCGKSTLLKLIGGLLSPTQGKICLHDTNLKDKTGFVFQEFALFPWRNVEDNIRFPLEVQKKSLKEQEEIIEKYLTLVGLTSFRNKFVHQLSGGMKQRVAIARALAQNVPILLMDEPFGALDQFTRRRIQDALLEIQEREKKTIIFVTHDIDEAVYLSSQTVVLSEHPGTIKGIVTISFAEKKRENVRDSEEFSYLKKKVWEMIQT